MADKVEFSSTPTGRAVKTFFTGLGAIILTTVGQIAVDYTASNYEGLVNTIDNPQVKTIAVLVIAGFLSFAGRYFKSQGKDLKVI